MGCIASKAAAVEAEKHAREEAHLGPPSKTMDASEHAQELVYMISKQIESDLSMLPVPGKRRHFKAETMIIREMDESAGDHAGGKMYYIKVKTSPGEIKEWPWLFVKLYEPLLITDVSRVDFKGLKKMKEDYKLAMF